MANSSVSSICCLYLEEVPQLQEERITATVTVTKTLVKKVKEVGERPAADHIQGDARGKKKMVGEEERLRRFKARVSICTSATQNSKRFSRSTKLSLTAAPLEGDCILCTHLRTRLPTFCL